MRMPMAIQRGEPRRRHGLVDRRPILDPGETPRRASRVLGEPGREIVGSQASVARTAAMVDEADDRPHAQRGDARQPLLAP